MEIPFQPLLACSPTQNIQSNGASFCPENEIISMLRKMTCPTCNIKFNNRFQLQEHIQANHEEFYFTSQSGEGSLPEEIQVLPVLESLNMCCKYEADMEEYPCHNEVTEATFLSAVRKSSVNIIESDIIKWKNLKVVFNMELNFVREREDKSLETKLAPYTSLLFRVHAKEAIARV